MNQPLIFTGSYSAADKPGIRAVGFDEGRGALSERGSFSGIANPSFVIANTRAARAEANGLILYAVSETSADDRSAPGSVWALKVEQKAGSDAVSITAINKQPCRGGLGCHLTLDSSGRWLLVANYGTGSAGVLPVRPDGSLGEMTSFVEHQGTCGPRADRQERPHAHSTTLSPDNRFVIIADLGLDQLVIYDFDRAQGTLTEHGRAPARPGAGPRHAVFHPNGRLLYVANELDSTVSAYTWDGAAGTLHETQTLDTIPASDPGNTVADIHIAAGANRLYLSNRGHDSIAVYDVDAGGRLARVAMPSCGGHWPRNFALPSERHMLVANQHSGTVVVLPILTGAPGLSAAVSQVGVPGACCIAVVA